MTANLSVLLAFGAGLSPLFPHAVCRSTLPFLSYVTGITMDEVKKGRAVFQRQALLPLVTSFSGFPSSLSHWVCPRPGWAICLPRKKT